MSDLLFAKAHDTWYPDQPMVLLERIRRDGDHLETDGAWFVPTAWELEAVTYGNSSRAQSIAAN